MIPPLGKFPGREPIKRPDSYPVVLPGAIEFTKKVGARSLGP